MSAAVMEEPAIATPVSVPTPPAKDELGPRWLPPAVLLAAITVAAGVYAYFWQHSHDLWWWIVHDRNAHYMNGLMLAFDVRTFDILRLWHDFDRIRVWGILHPILVGMIQLVAGPEYRLAVLPSVAGWILTIWCAFLIPRRLLPSGGNAAGLLAAFFIAVSPAYRAYATDVMYESLGAGLTLASLYLYLVVVQDGTRRAALLLGITMTLLFLHKYNYWALIVFGLFVGEFARQPRAWFQYVRSLCQAERLPRWLLGELKQPLNYVALAFATAALVVLVTGGWVVPIAGRNLSIQEPHNLVHFAYIAAFVRGILWWRREGQAWSLTLPPSLRTFLLCHGGAVAVWFLLPKRLSYFLWYLGPNNDDQRRASVPFMHGLPYYVQGIMDEYVTSVWTFYILAAMTGVTLLAAWKLKRGSLALACFFVVAVYLTSQHPMLKYRFAHSWIAAGFVLGSAGLIFVIHQASALILKDLRPWATGVTCALLIGLHLPVLFEPGRAAEGGLNPREPSPVRITEAYLPALADARQPAIVANVSARFLWTWTFIEHHRHHNMTADIKHLRTFEGDPATAQRWLDTTSCDALVMIDIQPGTAFHWKTKEGIDLTAFRQALAGQSAWTHAQRWDMPEGVRIDLWRKSPASHVRR